MRRELERQKRNIELIASENIVSPACMAAMGSVLTNKYAEGIPLIGIMADASAWTWWKRSPASAPASCSGRARQCTAALRCTGQPGGVFCTAECRRYGAWAWICPMAVI